MATKKSATARRKALVAQRSGYVSQRFTAEKPSEFALELGRYTMPHVIFTDTAQGREVVEAYALSGIHFEGYAFISQDGPLRGRMVVERSWFEEQDEASIGEIVLRMLGTQLQGVVTGS